MEPENVHVSNERMDRGSIGTVHALFEEAGYPLKAGQLIYDCRYSTMHGMPVTGGRGFRGLKPLWYNGVPPYVDAQEAEPLIHMAFCPEKPILAGFLESFAPCSVSTLTRRHDNEDVICLT